MIDALEAIEAIRDCQNNADMVKRPYSVCSYHGGLVVMLKVKAVELGYVIIETCNPVKK